MAKSHINKKKSKSTKPKVKQREENLSIGKTLNIDHGKKLSKSTKFQLKTISKKTANDIKSDKLSAREVRKSLMISILIIGIFGATYVLLQNDEFSNNIYSFFELNR